MVKRIFSGQSGNILIPTLIASLIVTILAVAIIPFFESMNRNIGVERATVRLESLSYVVLGAGEYTSIDNKLDAIQTTSDDIEEEVIEVEGHFHNRERWFGIATIPTATDWGEQASLSPYRVISGAGDFGSDANDEALVLGTDDTPAISGMTRFDAHRLEVTASSNAGDWVLRLIYGSGTMANAEAAGQYSDVMVQEARKGSPVEVIMPRGTCGVTQLWVKGKNANNNATLDFFVGVHEYLE